MTTNDSQPIVYVDFDDVLCQTARILIDVVEQRFGRRYVFEEIHSFNLEHSFQLSSSEHTELMRLVHEPDILRMMEPMPGALDVLNHWSACGVQTVVVTGRPPITEPACHEWLQRYQVSYERIVFVDKYNRAHETAGVEVLSPGELISMDFCLAVEDAPAMIRFLVEETQIPVAVMDRPWNRDLGLSAPTEDGQLTRCADWNAVATFLTSLAPRS